MPTPKTSELPRVVTSRADGAPFSLLTTMLAAPTIDGSAPVNAVTVIVDAFELLSVATTFVWTSAVGEYAHQISAIPNWLAAVVPAAFVQTRPTPPVGPTPPLVTPVTV